MSELYFKKALTSMEPYDPEIHDDTWLTVNRVSISEHDRANGSPKIGDMIASNPKARDDKWLVNEKYLKENYELDTRKPDEAKIDDNTFKQCFDRWVPNIDKEDEVDNDDIYAWCRNVLSMYLGIACKQSSEGSE